MRIKKVILLVSLLLALSSVAYAQKGKLEGGVDTRMSFYDDDLSLVATGAQFGYGFTDWFSAGLRLESSVSMFKTDGITLADNNATAGLYTNFNVLKFDSNVLSLSASGGASLKGNGWKYTYYDGLVRLDRKVGSWKIGLGLGARYYDSRNDFSGNKLRFYVMFGASFTF